MSFGVHLGGEEEGVSPQVVLHGPLESVLLPPVQQQVPEAIRALVQRRDQRPVRRHDALGRVPVTAHGARVSDRHPRARKFRCRWFVAFEEQFGDVGAHHSLFERNFVMLS